jgi:hypothetical protein
VQFVNVLDIVNNNSKKDSFLKLLSSYDCYGLLARTPFNFVTNNVLYYFGNIFAFQVPHQALLCSQPKLELREQKSSKYMRLSFIKFIGSSLKAVSGKCVYIKSSLFKTYLGSLTKTNLDTSIPTYKALKESIDSFTTLCIFEKYTDEDIIYPIDYGLLNKDLS